MKHYKLSFDISTLCNHQCTFCSNSDSRTIKAQVSKEKFVKVLDNITQHVLIDKISLSAKGEVLLNKELEEIAKLCKNLYKIPYVYFSTNGSLLDKKRSESILKSGIDSIKFSINATNKDAYQAIHLQNDFERVMENLRYFLENKRRMSSNIKVFISIVSEQKKEKVLQDFKKLLATDYTDISDIFVYELQYTPKYDWLETTIIDAKNCLIRPFEEIYVNSDCSLGFCCKDYFDEINFGSLLENDFMELYNHPNYKNMRQRFIENSFEKDSLCYKCLAFEGLKK
jgi:MoaA/NifB/PqqE/SkfB family radical SAM enzyme